MISSVAARQVLEDCRGVVHEVRFGFGSKRQIWAFEDQHKIDCSAAVGELAGSDPSEFLALAIDFHTEFSAVTGPWRVRETIQHLAARLCRDGGADFLDRVVEHLVDDRLALRHWLVSAFLSAPPGFALSGLENALLRAYQPVDQWAVLSRMQMVASDAGQGFSPETTGRLAVLAQFSGKSQDRARALELLAKFGAAGSSGVLANAARGDADSSVRSRAAELLGS